MVMQPFMLPPPRYAARVWRRLCLLLSCVLVLGGCTSDGETPTTPADPAPDGPQALIVTVADPMALAVEADGALVVVDRRLRAVVRVDPATGDHSLVSGLGRGAGPFVGFPAGIAVAPDGALAVTYNGFEGAVVRVDAATGDRTVLSGCAAVDPATFACHSVMGAGPPLRFPTGIAVLPDGALVVVDGTAVVRVDAATGDRTVLSGCAAVDPATFACHSVMGAGPPLRFPTGIAVLPDGALVVVDGTAVVRVDAATGDRTVLSGCTADGLPCPALIGAGPPLRFPTGIAVEAEGTLVVTDDAAVVRVDTATGDRTVLSGCTADGLPCPALIGAGPPLRFPTGIAVEAEGTLVVTDGESLGLGAVVRVHSATGDRIVLAEAHTTRIGAGPPLRFPTGIAVEAEGTLVVTDGESLGLGAVVRVHPATGDRTVLSGCATVDPVTFACHSVIGAGPPLRFPTGIAVEAEGTLVVTDESTGAVVRVDPATGDRTVLSGCVAIDATTIACFASAIGTGPPLHFPTDIAVLTDGALVVADDASMIVGNTGAVVQVHPTTGDRTVLSGCTAPDANTGECPVLTGDGPPLAFFARGGVAAEAGGAVVIADVASGVVRVDPSTGDRTVLSGCAGRVFPCPAPLGAGPRLGVLTGIAVAPDGAIVVVDEGFETGRVVGVHPDTGDRVLVAGFDREAHTHRGSGPLLQSPSGIAVEAEGALIVVDTMLRAVVRVAPLTGDRTLVSR